MGGKERKLDWEGKRGDRTEDWEEEEGGEEEIEQMGRGKGEKERKNRREEEYSIGKMSLEYK